MKVNVSLAAIGPKCTLNRQSLSRVLLKQISQASRSYVRTRAPFVTIGRLSFHTEAHRNNKTSLKMSGTSEPTAEQATKLFQDLEQKFPSKSLGEDRWYLIAVCYSNCLS